MPYITQEARERVDRGGRPKTAGELNYAISKLVDEYLLEKGTPRYDNYNEVMGALECAKQELYRRLIAPYEDQKLAGSGDIYRSGENRK